MQDSYNTLEKPAEGIYREKGSRFLAFGYPIVQVEEAKNIISVLTKKYHDARHHCYAYRIGCTKEICKTSDDGEPSGTAGKPIYGQLLANDLTNILVVVVRYFGGSLLGKGGLINAYRSATADMLAHAILIKRFAEVKISITFPYGMLNQVMKILKDTDLTPVEPVYDTMSAMVLVVRRNIYTSMIERLEAIPGLAHTTLQIGD
jgi:uncharacterized YigZ family protein